MSSEHDDRAANRAIGATMVVAILSLIMLLCMGCKTQYIPVTEYKERVVEVRVRDTAIVTVADSASVRALLHCDSAYNVVVDELTTLQGARIKADVTTKRPTNSPTKGLQIEVDCKEDSMSIVCHLKDSIISNLEKQVQVLSVPRERSGYDRFTSWFTWIVIAAILLYIILRVLVRFGGLKLPRV